MQASFHKPALLLNKIIVDYKKEQEGPCKQAGERSSGGFNCNHIPHPPSLWCSKDFFTHCYGVAVIGRRPKGLCHKTMGCGAEKRVNIRIRMRSAYSDCGDCFWRDSCWGQWLHVIPAAHIPVCVYATLNVAVLVSPTLCFRLCHQLKVCWQWPGGLSRHRGEWTHPSSGRPYTLVCKAWLTGSNRNSCLLCGSMLLQGVCQV